MNVWNKALAWLLVGLVILPAPVTAQDTSKSFQPEELEQIVAPIALHPDALLAQALMASTYPLEVIEAARFVQANPNVKGDQLNQALQQYTWDDSVKSLASFPQVLAMMNDKLDWLQKLGDAFLAQQQDLMAAIQRLRARAQASGQLQSTPEQSVVVEPTAAPPAQTTVQVVEAAPTVIRIEPTNPEVVYVPSYDPTVVYGGAWPPAYPPYSPYPFGYFAAGAFTFAAGAAVGAALWGGADWGRGEVNINNQKVNNFTNNVNNRTEARNRVEHHSRTGGTGAGAQGGRGNWQHNPEHRRGAQYRDTATQQRFNKTGPANAQARENFRGRTQQGGGDFSRGAGAQQSGLGGRERQGGFSGQQPSASIGERGGQARQAGSGQARQAGSGQVRQAGGFEGVGGGGRDAQSFSNRGNASRESLNRSAGGSRPSGGGAAAARGGGGGGARGGGGGRGGGGRR